MKAIRLTVLLPALWLCLFSGAAAQNAAARRPLVVSVFSTGSQLPGGAIFQPVHPGIDVGTEFRYNDHPRNQCFQTLKGGVYYHRYNQTAIQLYTEAGFRRLWWKGLGTELRLGAGYLHAITDLQQFALTDGVYRRKHSVGRPQFMGSAAAGLSYGWRECRFFVDYQFALQMPFIRQYVPLLPATSVHLGVALPIF